MAIKPILFNTEMVRAIQDGRKTATRRICKGDKPPFERGDILWVRETWAFWPCITCGAPCVSNPQVGVVAQFGRRPDTLETADGLTEGCFLYRADDEAPVFPGGHIWRPSIQMPRQAARIFLRVTDVTCEQIQDIDEAGARAEGLHKGWQRTETSTPAASARQAFMWLWQELTRKGPIANEWAANPLVWVIQFERIEKPAGWPR